ncbi:pentatricopeptide repeat-containing protein At4g14820 [Salvia miltiorrhiza]|uniref:pentatricopeptide repeat-containing protein At4g14820 n=1 Tax=Salvia miltiorrhiza TaxID=226208 RepID=UPI0025AC7A08|nr:pentatricopeptide repeat-containing protein At4g14820 [Salvia miltiorrhiza]XP_057783425.1 pentatricopeptide repeat-containing protein At4g14820 [Salvia miltiorrhiza]XP_057783426.1 pentatricopeptide repeat-containing protein At4g14820 [Salvia miltiorrhiza]XP_057783427.1 pentatricopeptide repeat-containing protein At4g14820 [Salvia miltiorrhiza]
MAHPLPSAALPPVPAPLCHPPNFAHLISTATALPHLKQIQAQILRNSHHHHHNHHLFQLLLYSLPFPTYALSLLSFIPTDSPPPPQLPNKILKHLSRSDGPHKALVFFQAMQNKFFPIDRYSFPPLLKAASRALSLSEGKMIHGLAAKLGYESDPFVQTALLGMYAACGLISEARLVFDKMPQRDVVTWNIMIDGYCQSRLFDNVLALLEEMKSSEVQPDARVFTTILAACSRVGNLDFGRLVQGYISESNVVFDYHLQTALLNMYISFGAMDLAQSFYDELKPKNVVASTAMITGYSKVGNLEAARLIFAEMVDRDLVCWSAMISGYANSDEPREALKIFHEMQNHGIKPDQVTMLSVISACARLGALDKSTQICSYVDEKGFGTALPIANALIDMYAKCGSLDRAKEVYGRMHRKNVISWTSMINAFATHGDVDNALRHFRQMRVENVEPNWITFVGVLYACSHAGLVEEGEKLFESMVKEYGIAPRLEHYGCMVDLYGRAGRLRDALEIVESMPMAPNVVIWGSLMASCRVHGESELGEFAAKRLLEIDPDHDGALVFLSNIYAKERKWENVGVVRNAMKHKGVSKERGCSMIETDDDIHTFLTADKSHKQTDEIYAKLDEVVAKLREVGYVPNTDCVLTDLSEDEKKEAVLWHSEKLALCYGLISKEKQSTIRIIKNLRICEDCHNFMKMAARVLDRDIIIRDRTRFHHCRDGVCSCKDYW